MLILGLPSEIQFIIISYIKQDNHLDLAPLAQTCTYYNKILSDKFNWKHTIKLVQTDDNAQQHQLDYLMLAVNRQSSMNYSQLSSIAINDKQLARLTLNILKKSSRNLKVIQVCLPFELHAELYQTLSCLDTQLIHLSIRDSTCEYKRALNNVKSCLLPLIQSQSTLQTLDIPSFPSHELCYQHYRFPKLKSLTIALNHDVIWSQFKNMFPNLIELTFIITHLSQLTLVKSLLSDVSLFPWFKRLSIVSHEPLKQHVSKEELKSSLLQLEGLRRITAGWDIIALS
ncbi:hypothetical protein CU097_011244 [Rhizopus azygosporus]|uniref:F-box domain-containing protein n=1 Tax=Rhizopus azygosporus TaxID=86630 RepID=A0A367JVW2_RHIAZ|nr:hypothetical protein CU097_011244 [Rhizopus azygosporus]